MAEEKKENWLNYLALTTVILAVCATLSTFKGGGYSTRSVLAQSQASDLWSFYQAKSIKQYIYEIQKEKLGFDLREKRQKLPADIVADYENKIKDYAQKIEKYTAEKTKIEKDAKELESTRDVAKQHSQQFGMAVIFLQIAILLSSTFKEKACMVYRPSVRGCRHFLFCEWIHAICKMTIIKTFVEMAVTVNNLLSRG